MDILSLVQTIIGFIGLIAIAIPFSDNFKIINYKYVVYGILSQVVLAVIFPPLSILWNYHLGYYSIWETIKKFFTCLLLTMCFYLPGLIYAINELSCKARVKISEEKYLDKTLQKAPSKRIMTLVD